MYDDKDFETLQEEMREESDLEGSFMDTGIAKQAVRLEEGYANLEYVYDNILVDTQDEDHLVESGMECGMPRIEGTPATVRAKVNCVLEEGTEFTASDSEYDYIVTGYIDTITDEDDVTWNRYELEAEETGAEPGEYRGDIEPIDEVEDFEEGVIDATIEAGTDDEDIEDYRERRMNSFGTKACAGNRAYYINTIHDNFEVGGVKAERRTASNAYIEIYIQAADYGVPSQTLINNIKETMDPEGYEGEGMGLTPIGHLLHIQGVTGVNVAVAAEFTFDDDYSFATLQTAITNAADGYILDLKKEWEDNQSSPIVVRISGLESAMLAVEGVLDVGNATINGTAANLSVDAHSVPVLTSVSEVS